MFVNARRSLEFQLTWSVLWLSLGLPQRDLLPLLLSPCRSRVQSNRTNRLLLLPLPPCPLAAAAVVRQTVLLPRWLKPVLLLLLQTRMSSVRSKSSSQ